MSDEARAADPSAAPCVPQANVTGPEPTYPDDLRELLSDDDARATAVAGASEATPAADAAGAGAADVMDALDALDGGMDMGDSEEDEDDEVATAPGDGGHGSASGGSERGEWCRAAQHAMARGGEPCAFRCGAAQYLLLAQALLRTAAAAPGQEAELVTAQWWLARALVAHQRALVGPAAELRDAARAAFAAARTGGAQWLPAAAAAAVELEDALADALYARPAAANRKLAAAAKQLGVRLEVVGAMGFRTVHQVDAKAQLVVQLAREGAGAADAEAMARTEAAARAAASAADGTAALSDAAMAARTPHERAEAEGLAEAAKDCDVLEAPRIEGVGTDAAASGPPALRSVELCLVMATAHIMRKSTTEDDLSPWEQAPYVDCIAAQPHAPFSVALAAGLERARHERTRGRTRARGLARLQDLSGAQRLAIGEPPAAAAALRAAVAASADGGTAAAAGRAVGCFATPAPLAGGVRKELAQALVSNGMVGSALPLLEALEVWEALAACYKALGKAPAAVAAVRKRLDVDQRDARAWLVLGELEDDESLMTKAWDVSDGRLAAAKRALARRCAAREDHAGALEHWRAAQRVASLHVGGWFALGYAALKLGHADEAARAFSRTVQLDSKTGEAWNNLAALHLKAGRTRAAHVALEECVRMREHSWHAWDNLSEVAGEVRRYRQAANAARRTMALTKGARVNVRALAAAVAEVERVVKDPDAVAGGPKAAARAAAKAQGKAAREEAAEEALMRSLDDIGLDGEGEEGNADTEDADSSAYAGEEIVGMAAEEAFKNEELPVYSDREIERLVADVAAALADASKATPDGKELYKADGTPLRRAASGDDVDDLTQGGAMGAIWALQARMRVCAGDFAGAAEFTMRRMRALQGGTEWRSDSAAFGAFARACSDLANARLGAAAEAQEAAQKATCSRELASARMQLRGVLKQGKEAFGGGEAYKALDETLARVGAEEDRLREEAKA